MAVLPDCGVDLDALAKALDANNIRPEVYDLDVQGFSLPSERFCIRKEGPAPWVTYFSERGERVGERVWITETEACEALLEAVLQDRGTRRE
jgi:hypothetical protein